MRTHRRPEPGPAATGAPRAPAVPRPDRLAPTSSAAVRQLQQSVGNRATSTVLQRAPTADGTITDPAELARSRPVGGAVDVETRVRLIETLLSAPRSKQTLDAIEKLRGDLNFPIVWSAKGNFVTGSGKSATLSLDRRNNEGRWLSSAAHEIFHLHDQLAGTAANVQTMGREEYVNAQMTEEIDAHSAGYVTQLQLGRTTSASAGYDEFVALLKKSHAELLKKKDWGAIEALAKPFVKKKYETDWVGSKSGKNYYDKWRKIWDAAHPGGR
jgi:hypothetical protein